MQLSPKMGSVWSPSLKWLFLNDVQTIAKVAWNVLIQPKSNGGLGLIDPLMQLRALLTKFVIRGLLP